MAGPDTRAAAGPAARVCKPRADPRAPGGRGGEEGETHSGGQQTVWGPRASQGRGAPEPPRLRAPRAGCHGAERSHKVKARPLSCVSCVPCPCPGGRWTSSASFPQRRAFNCRSAEEKVLHLMDPVPAGNQEIKKSRPALDSEPRGDAESKAGDQWADAGGTPPPSTPHETRGGRGAWASGPSPSQPFWPRVAERASRLRGAPAEHRAPPGRQGPCGQGERSRGLSACTPCEWRAVSVKLAY